MELFHALHQLAAYGAMAFFVGTITCIPLYVLAKMWFRARAAKRWPKVEGIIVRSEAQTAMSDSDGEIFKHSIVEYEYKRGERIYQSRRFYLMIGLPDLTADELVAKYPKGAKVTVYCNPADPVDCALNNCFSGESIRNALQANGAFFLCGIIGICIFTPLESFLVSAVTAPFSH